MSTVRFRLTAIEGDRPNLDSQTKELNSLTEEVHVPLGGSALLSGTLAGCFNFLRLLRRLQQSIAKVCWAKFFFY